MSSKRKQSKSAAGDAGDAAYQAALDGFAAAVQAFGKGDYAATRDAMAALVAAHPDEIELCARARAYMAACDQRMAPAPAPSGTAEDLYYRGVVALNARDLDGASALLDEALTRDPDSAGALYARASLRALRDDASGAVEDLRRAAGVDPTVRFQAANDPDFDSIRDQAAFIDIVEPTATEA